MSTDGTDDDDLQQASFLMVVVTFSLLSLFQIHSIMSVPLAILFLIFDRLMLWGVRFHY